MDADKTPEKQHHAMRGFSNCDFPEKHEENGAPGARRAVTWIVAGLALALAPALWKPWIHGNDGARNYAYVRSFWLDGDLDFTNEFDHYRATGDYQITLPPDATTGRPGNALGIGCAILWSPFFWAGHAVALLSGAPADGYSAPYAWAISVGSTLYAIAGLALLARLMYRRFGFRPALIGVLGAWLGSPLVFYMYLHPSMSHACSFFLAALLLWQFERWREIQRLRHFFLIGFVCGLAIATRLTDGVCLLLVLAFVLRGWLLPASYETDRFDNSVLLVKATLLAALGVAIGFLPQMAAWRYFHGSWFAGPRNYELAENLTLWKSPHLLDLLLSGWRGMFVWSPALLLGALGFSLLLARRRLVDLTLAVMFLVQLWVIGGWTMWWGGASFGQRFFINFTPGFAFGIGWLFICLEPGKARKTYLALVAACVLWSGGLAVQYVSEMIPREKPVRLPTLVSNQLRKVPAAALEHVRFLWPGERAIPSEKEPNRKP